MGALKDSEYQALAALSDGKGQHQHGWATDDCGIDLKIIDRLHKMGLCEMADANTLRQLHPDPPHWAARLTPEGHDTLTYLPTRRSTTRPPHPSTSERPQGTREVRLRPAAMDTVRLCLRLAADLHRLPDAWSGRGGPDGAPGRPRQRLAPARHHTAAGVNRVRPLAGGPRALG
nr:DUF6417 family protein [Streptomyces cinnamoneus]